MRISRRPGTNANVFTGTMADISFLLVVFFMITAAFAVTKGLDLTMDESQAVEQEYEPWEAIDVHVQADGGLRVDGETMALTDLLPYVWSKLDKNPGKPVMLRSAPTATYGAMIQVLDELRQSDEKMGFVIRNLAIPTYREQRMYSHSFEL